VEHCSNSNVQVGSDTGKNSSLESVQRLVSQLFVLGEDNIVRLGRMESIFIHAARLWWLLPMHLMLCKQDPCFFEFLAVDWLCSVR
jgi:hypothetical protein